MKRISGPFTFISALFVLNLAGHGFVADTSIHNFGNSPSRIKCVCACVAKGKKQRVASWDSASARWHSAHVKAVGHAHVNCTITIRFDQDTSHDITCTPSQSFCCVARRKWIPAYLLQEGDCLLTESGGSVYVHDVSYRKKPATVYMLEIEKTHTFCVGHYRVLTHNMPLACTVMIGLSGSFGTGIAAGGATGGFFGPVICVAGCVVGGLLGIATSLVLNSNKIPRYHVTFNTDAIEGAVPDKKPKKIGEEGEKEIEDGGKAKETESGAQAPGKPTEEDGFIPPKRWDGKKVRHPKSGQYGWPDDAGNVWVPSGRNGHGGEHWDVQSSKGKKYDNVYPGGKIRTGK
jgi:hypothetical protein